MTRMARRKSIVLCMLVGALAGNFLGFDLCAEEVALQHQGASLEAAGNTDPPVILLGSGYPIQQTLRLRLVNRGSEPLKDFRIVCRAPEILPAKSEILSLQPGQNADVSLPLRPAAGIEPGVPVDVVVEAMLPGGEIDLVGRTRTLTALAHPLLRSTALPDDSPFSIVQVSDPHILAGESVLHGVRTAARLKSVVNEINAMQPLPDFVVVTGDIIIDDPKGYAVYDAIMSELRVPFLSAFGNHDKPTGLAEAERVFSQWGHPPFYAFAHKGYAFVVLDSVAAVNPRIGTITDSQLAWLKSSLRQLPGSRLLLFFHHDLFSDVGVTNHEAVESILQGDPREKWIFAGHWHLDFFMKRETERHVITATTGYLTGGRNHYKHNRLQPGYRLIRFEGEEITTRFKPVGGPPVPDPGIDHYYTVEEMRALLEK